MSGMIISEITILPTGHAANAERCLAFYETLDVPTVEIPMASDYLDWLSHADLPSPVIKGRDALGRRFVAFRLACKYDADEAKSLVAVAHERYKNRSDLWVMAGGAGYVDQLLGFPNPDIDGIQRLLKDGSIVHNEHGLVCETRLVEVP